MNDSQVIHILPEGLTLDIHTSEEDFPYIQGIIESNNLSYYLLDKKDFFVIKDTNEQIIAFGRLYFIGENAQEVSSVRVHPDWRGYKLGLYLTEQLIQQRGDTSDIFLATKRPLSKYYGSLGFKEITNNIPEKLIHTGIWAKENGIEFVIMKYKR